MWNELTFLWNELTILWNDLTTDWNDLTWNEMTGYRRVNFKTTRALVYSFLKRRPYVNHRDTPFFEFGPVVQMLGKSQNSLISFARLKFCKSSFVVLSFALITLPY